MTKKFKKRTYSIGGLVKDLGFLLIKTPQIISALRNKKISGRFMEKIMLVVTAVNGCIYCSWYHARRAVNSGIPKSEVKKILKLQFKTEVMDYELSGLLYAQHYAETNRNPDKEMKAELYKFYGEKTANHIYLFIRLIFVGNLLGNTFEVFLKKIKRNKVPANG